MGTAIVGVVGSLLGVLLGFLGQSFRAKQEHKWTIETAKREVYSEFLRSISASYAQEKLEAKSRQSDTPEAKYYSCCFSVGDRAAAQRGA